MKLNAYDAACLRAVGIGEGNRNTRHMNRKLDTMGLVRPATVTISGEAETYNQTREFLTIQLRAGLNAALSEVKP